MYYKSEYKFSGYPVIFPAPVYFEVDYKLLEFIYIGAEGLKYIPYNFSFKMKRIIAYYKRLGY